MTAIHRSLAFSASERYASVILSILSTAILARLLAPWEFGVYAVISGLTAVATAAFQEFGGANYIIQRQTLSDRDIRTAFTVTFVMSMVYASALFASRHAVAAFFGQPGLDHGLAVLCSTFLITPFSVITGAILRREMKFGVLALATLSANLANATVSVALALLGASYMAPIWGAVSGAAVLALLLITNCRSVTLFWPCLEGARSVLHFGAYSSAVVIVNIFSQFFPQFILGRFADFGAVGLYGRGVSITQLFDRLVLQVLNPVIMPALFTESRAGGNLKLIYLASIELISAVQWPFLIFLAVMCEPIIAIWLGPAWTPVVPLVRSLCIASLALFAACLTYPMLLAAGRIRDTLTTTLITLPPTLAIVYAVAPYGAEAVAASTLLTMPIQAAVSIGFVAHRLEISPVELLRAARKSIGVTILSTVGPAAMLAASHIAGSPRPIGFLGLCGAGLLALGGWLFGLSATRHPLLGQLRGAAAAGLGQGRRLALLLRSVTAQEAKLL